MKKTVLALLFTGALSAALVGCGSDTNSTAQANSSKSSNQQIDLNGNSQSSASTNSDTNSTTAQAGVATDPDTAQDEIRKVFSIGSDYQTLNMLALSSLAMGNNESTKMAIDQKTGLSLAKSISGAMGNMGWAQEDHPPALFITVDGKSFHIGYKKKNGDLYLETYQQQTDGSYKSVNKQTKKAA